MGNEGGPIETGRKKEEEIRSKDKMMNREKKIMINKTKKKETR